MVVIMKFVECYMQVYRGIESSTCTPEMGLDIAVTNLGSWCLMHCAFRLGWFISV